MLSRLGVTPGESSFVEGLNFSRSLEWWNACEAHCEQWKLLRLQMKNKNLVGKTSGWGIIRQIQFCFFFSSKSSLSVRIQTRLVHWKEMREITLVVSDEFLLVESFKKEAIDLGWYFSCGNVFFPRIYPRLVAKKQWEADTINPMVLAVFLGGWPFSNGSKQQYKDQADALQLSVESKTFSKFP